MATKQKTCTKCKVPKSLGSFSPDKRAKDGKQSACRTCQEKWRKSPKGRKYVKKYNQSGAGKYAQNKYKNSAKGKTKNKDLLLKNKYGLSFREFNMLFYKQKGCCVICGRHQSELKRRLSVDHNHKTGQVRGLLCINCNTGIGNLRDSKSLLFAAISYLGKYDD